MDLRVARVLRAIVIATTPPRVEALFAPGKHSMHEHALWCMTMQNGGRS
jgi:hypothetical protein